uniref:Contactin/TAG-1 cell adhesion molecule n=1 Tax=Dugesia japonica TaxID=6161 RepID=Q1JUB4_DUGJA|nr:contactin/TAG-1 cell adhesion molecule [Dugesia japonica]
MKWMFNLTADTDLNYFICEASKRTISETVTISRSADFGQSDLTNVYRGPCIINQPTDQLYAPAVTSVNTVTFTCDVYGDPFPKVSWYFTTDTAQGPQRTLIDPMSYTNGKVTQTGGILTINDPDNTFDNKIDCQADNDYGSVISRQVQIIRGRLDSYNRNPRQIKRIADNTGFMLDCEPPAHSPDDTLVYTFYITRKNDKGETVDDIIQSQLRNNIFLSHNLGLIGFSIASLKDSGLYKCRVAWKGIAGTSYNSPEIPLEVYASNTIYPVPSINDKFPNFKPSNPFLGDTIEFECFGYGEIKQNPLKYFWTWNGKALPSKAVISDFERRVRLENIQFEDEGVYGCTIETMDGKISQPRSVKLTINAKPTFVVKPKNQYPDIGSTITLTCQAIGRPLVTVQWYRNDLPLSKWLMKNPDARYNYTEGNITTALFTITGMKTTDNAMIGCNIYNTFGRESAYIELFAVSLKPNFDKYPLLNKEGLVGMDVIIPCKPEGSPAPTITWSFNGGTLTLGPTNFDQILGKISCAGDICIMPNRNLFIKSVKTSHIGMYTCTAVNVLGTASSSAYLDVIPKLEISNFPVGRRVQVNSNVYLPCQAAGTPYLDIDYDWYFENVRLKFDRMDLDARRYDKSQFMRPYYRYFGTLKIFNIQFYDEANYTCRVTTPFAVEVIPALIQVLGPPGVGGGITVTPVVGTVNHTVEWTDGYDHGSPILWYRLEVSRVNVQQEWIILLDKINKTSITPINKQNNLVRNQLSFSGLPANTNFRLRLFAANSFGLGEPSSQSEVFKTEAIPPQKSPQNVTGGGGKVGTLVIRWEPLLPLEENGDNFEYEIQYKEAKEVDWISYTGFLNKSLDNGKYLQVTRDLPANKDYLPFEVKVRAVNIKGAGPWSAISTITSSSKLPSFAPLNINADSLNSTAINVQWAAPSVGQGEGPIQGYHIVYWMRVSDCKSQAASYDRLNTSQRLTLYGSDLVKGIIIGLQPDKYYCIGVQMFNTAGDSLESSFVDQTTFKMPPQNFPTIVRLNSTNTPHQIQVTWNGVRVMPEEESVDGYRIRYWLSGGPVRTALDVDVGLKVTGYINDLQYDVRYNMRIFAYSRGGNGKLSNPMDQFMLIPKSRCQSNKVIEGPDVRYVFVCCSCKNTISILLLSLAVIVSRFVM